MDLHQRIQKCVQVCKIRAADLLIEIPAHLWLRTYQFCCQGHRTRIGHFCGNPVVLAFLKAQRLIVGIQLHLELHDVVAFRQFIGDIFHKTCLNTVHELGLVHNQDIAQVTFGSACGIDCFACHLRCNNVELNIKSVLDDFRKPTGLNAVIVCRVIIKVNGQERSVFCQRESAYRRQ